MGEWRNYGLINDFVLQRYSFINDVIIIAVMVYLYLSLKSFRLLVETKYLLHRGIAFAALAYSLRASIYLSICQATVGGVVPE